MAKYDLTTTTLGTLLADPQVVEIMERHAPGITNNPMLAMAKGMPAEQAVGMAGGSGAFLVHLHGHVHALVARRHVVVCLFHRRRAPHRHARGGMRIRRAIEQQHQAEQGTEQGGEPEHAGMIRHGPRAYVYVG